MIFAELYKPSLWSYKKYIASIKKLEIDAKSEYALDDEGITLRITR